MSNNLARPETFFKVIYFLTYTFIYKIINTQSTVPILTASVLFRRLSLNIVAYSRLSLASYLRNILY